MACVTGQAPSTAHAHKMTMIRTVVIVRKAEIGIFYLKYNIQGWCVVAFLRGAGVIPHCKRAVPLAEHGNPPPPPRRRRSKHPVGICCLCLLWPQYVVGGRIQTEELIASLPPPHPPPPVQSSSIIRQLFISLQSLPALWSEKWLQWILGRVNICRQWFALLLHFSPTPSTSRRS